VLIEALSEPVALVLKSDPNKPVNLIQLDATVVKYVCAE
jgi:hypothetical protein